MKFRKHIVKVALALALTVVMAAPTSFLNVNSRAAAVSNGTMYMAANTVMATGSDWSIQIRVSTGGQSVNAVQSDLTYPAGILTFTSVSAAGSAFDFDAATSGGSGTVSIVRGTTTPQNGDLLVATVVFHVITTGTANLVFQNSSALLASSDSSNILGTKTDGSFPSSIGPISPVYRLHSKKGPYLYPTNPAEVTSALGLGDYINEGTAYRALMTNNPGYLFVYRLRAPNGVHFYTANTPERNNAIVNLHYTDEGTAFYAYPVAASGWTPVYRLRAPKTAYHLFTINPVERDMAVQTAGFTSEGIAWYTPL